MSWSESFRLSLTRLPNQVWSVIFSTAPGMNLAGNLPQPWYIEAGTGHLMEMSILVAVVPHRRVFPSSVRSADMMESFLDRYRLSGFERSVNGLHEPSIFKSVLLSN